MPNYTKLFNSIVTSTIWTEDDKTRIVWITMLAISDQNGEVHASIPGLARLAGVSVEDAEKAINCFLGPDKYSRTEDFEGRRIVKISGGWELLNHTKYRKMASKEDAKEANAERQRRFRDREKERNATVTDSNATVTDECDSNGVVTEKRDIAEAEADTEVEKVSEAKASSCPPKPDKTKTFLESLWNLSPQKARERSSKKQVMASWKAVKSKPDFQTVLESMKLWIQSEDWQRDNGQYVQGLHLWIKHEKWESTPELSKQTGNPSVPIGKL